MQQMVLSAFESEVQLYFYKNLYIKILQLSLNIFIMYLRLLLYALYLKSYLIFICEKIKPSSLFLSLFI